MPERKERRSEALAVQGGRGEFVPDTRQLLFLHRATELMFADPLDYERTLSVLARLAVPEFADVCVIDLARADGGIDRVEAYHHDETRRALMEEMKRRPITPGGAAGPGRVIQAGTSEIHPSVNGELLQRIVRDARTAEILGALGLSSLLSAPLACRGRTFGALSLALCGGGRHFTEHDLRFAEELAARVALAIDNARLFREAEEARLRAEASAAALEKAADFGQQLLGIVSHDLRTPLAAIKGSVQLALKRAGEDEALAKPLRRLASSADRMERMIRDLLDFTRARVGGGIPLLVRETDLGKIARYVVEEMAAAKPEHPIQYQLVYERGLWDADRMTQMVSNLVSNAAQHGAERAPIADGATFT